MKLQRLIVIWEMVPWHMRFTNQIPMRIPAAKVSVPCESSRDITLGSAFVPNPRLACTRQNATGYRSFHFLHVFQSVPDIWVDAKGMQSFGVHVRRGGILFCKPRVPLGRFATGR
jgi:hypothetical protein